MCLILKQIETAQRKKKYVQLFASFPCTNLQVIHKILQVLEKNDNKLISLDLATASSGFLGLANNHGHGVVRKACH
jgi:hypothetical protein